MLQLPMTIGRPFRLWSFAVTHSTLLLRSNIAPGLETRVDVLFKEVRFVLLKSHYSRLEIEPAAESESQRLAEEMLVDLAGRFVFTLGRAGTENWGLVVAGSLFVAEDDLTDGHPSVIDHREFADHVKFQDHFY